MSYYYAAASSRSPGSPEFSDLGAFSFQNKPKFQTSYDSRVNSYNNLSYSVLNVAASERETSSPDSVIEIDDPKAVSGNSEVTVTPVFFVSNENSQSTIPTPHQNLQNLNNLRSQPQNIACSNLGGSMDSPLVVTDDSDVDNNDTYGMLCDKERCLRKLLTTCPMADIMEAQDILVSCGWDLQKAIEIIRSTAGAVEERPTLKSKSTSKNSNHLISVNNISSSSAPPKSASVDEIVLDSDSDGSLGITVADSPKKDKFMKLHSNGVSYTANVTSVANPYSLSSVAQAGSLPSANSVHSLSPVAKPISSPSVAQTISSSTYKTKHVVKKRKRVQCLDDDDSDNSNSLSSTANFYSHAASSTNAVTNNQQQGFSVLDFKPNMSSPTATPVKSYTYSKNPSYKPSFERTIDDSIFKTEESPAKSPVQSLMQRYSHPRKKISPKVKSSSKKRRTKIELEDDDDDEDYGNDIVYDSDDSDVGENLTPGMNKVLTFFREASADELSTIPGCSKKKADAIISYRPFESWGDLVQKINLEKCLSTDLLNGAKKVLDMRSAVTKLMNKCRKIALQMEDLVEALKANKQDFKDYVSVQPSLLNSKMQLTSYQMLGLNWLLLMHNQEVNGILADEMGLGKTIQAIAFLAYLKKQDVPGPHLIVVPSSTLDNWLNELEIWWPTASVLCYHGSQENRRELRLQIINDEVDEFDVMVSTYNMVTSSNEDRGFFKRLEFYYVIFDEAHMLKNMASQRYQNLMRVRATRRLLLTGTPLQNNLVELMSLLIFAMPHMFSGKTEQIKLMFSAVSKKDDNKTSFEKDKIEHAKRIMKPFVLRRLKSEVLQDLPLKHEEIKHCLLSKRQLEVYLQTVHELSQQMRENKEKDLRNQGAGMMMKLRKAANHPLLLRKHFSDDKLIEMSKLMLREPTHCEANPDMIFEDMSVMSDFELHRLCKQYSSLKHFILSDDMILDSGKFQILETMLPDLIEKGHRMLLFSQFTMVLDIVEDFMKIKKFKFHRLDGQVPVHERQALIDDFNQSPDILIFLLSTRAGGLGINLTSADTVIIHDIDFNPYNDKQAEDRCHRVGQKKDVYVTRLISKDTIEEGILKRALDKLKLERDVTANDSDEENDSLSVAALLKDALEISDKS